MTTPILEAKELTQKFGGLTAVDNVSLHVGVDELVALIGPNGAGKTTLFNMLTGVNAPTEGDVYLAGEKLPAKRLMPWLKWEFPERFKIFVCSLT